MRTALFIPSACPESFSETHRNAYFFALNSFSYLRRSSEVPSVDAASMTRYSIAGYVWPRTLRRVFSRRSLRLREVVIIVRSCFIAHCGRLSVTRERIIRITLFLNKSNSKRSLAPKKLASQYIRQIGVKRA